MKAVGYLLGVAVLSIGLAISCTPSRNTIAGSGSIPSPSRSGEPMLASLSEDDLEYVRRFAEAYEPKSGDVVIPSPPEPDKRVSNILAIVAENGTRDHEKFVILIFLRLSRFQSVHFKQGYELGRTNPLTVEFYRLIGLEDYQKRELITPGEAEIYVRTHPELRRYPPIDREMRIIDEIDKKSAAELKRLRREIETTPK
jgi:hypothetical protein